MDLLNIYNIFKSIQDTGVRAVKEKILKDNENNEGFRKVLEFLLNPYVVTGISTKKMKKEIEPFDLEIGNHNFDNMGSLLAYLRRSNTGSHYDVYVVQSFIEKQASVELREFVRKIVTKDLKLGISEKTVNKVYGKGVIPTFAVMLAESFEKKENKVTGKFFVTLKLDGNRSVAIVKKDGVKFFSRKGQAIEGMLELEEQFSKFPHGVYDGELLLNNKYSLPSDELFRATQKVVRKDGEKKNLEFHIFDTLTVAEFQDGVSKRNYSMRRNTLDSVILNFANESKFIHVLPVIYEGDDKGVIPLIVREVESRGLEGVMVNTAEGLYQTKRTTDLLKVKTMKTADLLVMSVEKAIDGQFEGLLSRVNVEYKGGLCGVGSGFTLEDRKAFIDNPDLICGKIIEVSYFEESKSEKTGLPSLRFPVYKGIREDKGVEDINYGE